MIIGDYSRPPYPAHNWTISILPLRFARAKCNVVLRKCQHSVETKWNNSVGSSSNEKVQRRGSRKVSRDVVEDINIAERTEVVPAVSAEVRDTQLCSDSGICEITKESGITAVDT